MLLVSPNYLIFHSLKDTSLDGKISVKNEHVALWLKINCYCLNFSAVLQYCLSIANDGYYYNFHSNGPSHFNSAKI